MTRKNMAPSHPGFAIGCDVGATHTRSALVDLKHGKIIQRRHHASRVGDDKAGLAALSDDVTALMAHAGAPCSVGVAIAAQLDPGKTRVLVAPNLKWNDVPLQRALQKKLGVAVRLDNDVRAAALGELRFGGLKASTPTALCLFWGSGIGGAVIHRGEVLSGRLGLSGEIGHLTYKAGGLRCGCGKRGCFEAYAGGHAFDRRARRLDATWRGAADLLRAAAAGDRRAAKARTETVRVVAQLVASALTLLDADKVLIGGGLGLALYRDLTEATKEFILPARGGDLPLVRARHGDDAGLLGAAALA